MTAEAGALYIDVAEELLKHGLQFYVNTEIGNLSVGSAACCGTKDSSMPGEFGQVGSYVTRLKMILPSGDLLEVSRRGRGPDAEGPVELRDIRDRSRGDVSRCGRSLPMAVHHETFELEDFIAQVCRR